MKQLQPTTEQLDILQKEISNLAARCVFISLTTSHDVEFSYDTHDTAQVDIFPNGYDRETCAYGSETATQLITHIDWNFDPDMKECWSFSQTLAWFTEVHLELDSLTQAEAA